MSLSQRTIDALEGAAMWTAIIAVGSAIVAVQWASRQLRRVVR